MSHLPLNPFEKNAMPVALVKLTEAQVAAMEIVDQAPSLFEKTRTAIFLLIKTKVWENYNLERDDFFRLRFDVGFQTVQKFLSNTDKAIGHFRRDPQKQIASTPTYTTPVNEDADEIDPSLDEVIPDTPAEAKEKAKNKTKLEKAIEKAKERAAAKSDGSLDRAGHVVPACLAEVFANQAKWMELYEEAKVLGRQIASLARLVGGEGVCADRSLVYTEVDNHGQVVSASCHAMNTVCESLEFAMPFSVCPTCAGLCVETENLCITCNEHGWLTMGQWMKCDNKDALEVA